MGSLESIFLKSQRAIWFGGAYSVAWLVLSYILSGVGPASAEMPTAELLLIMPLLLAAAWAGWLISVAGHSFIHSGCSGTIVFFVAHPIVHGVMFLLQAIFAGMPQLGMVLAGVLTSFVLFSPVFFFAGVAGAAAARVVSAIRGRAA